jgi:hypothetical protein
MYGYEKIGVPTAVLLVREFQRATLTQKLGSNWTEARIGMYFSGVADHETNIAPPDEDLAVADVSDYLTFGLKDASTYALPGESGGLFIGVRSTGATSQVQAPGVGSSGYFADSSEQCSAVGYAGTTLIDGGVVQNGSLRFPDPEPDESFNGFYCVRFVVSGRGLSTQTVSVSVARSEQVDGADYGKAALYQAISNAAFGTARNVSWNTGVSARTLPDTAWVRIPFYNARIRIQAMMAVKVSP